MAFVRASGTSVAVRKVEIPAPKAPSAAPMGLALAPEASGWRRKRTWRNASYFVQQNSLVGLSS